MVIELRPALKLPTEVRVPEPGRFSVIVLTPGFDAVNSSVVEAVPTVIGLRSSLRPESAGCEGFTPSGTTRWDSLLLPQQTKKLSTR